MRLRNLFTDEEIQTAIENAADFPAKYSHMAQELSNLRGVEVTRQLARYWATQFDIRKKNGAAYLTLTVANREAKKAREIRTPSPSDQLAEIEQSNDATRILYFTDTHAPYVHQDALAFLEAVRDAFLPTLVIHGGDEVDNHALSFHDSDPNLAAAGDELVRAREFIHELHELFPDVRLCESNHGSLHYRRAKAHGIPVEYLRTYREILFPGGGGECWSWHDHIRIQLEHGRDLQFQHQCNGDLLKGAAHENANLIVGHEHSKYGIGYGANAVETYWSVYGGCLVDTDSMAYSYGKLFASKPVLGAVLIDNGVPHCIPMRTDNHNRWVGDV